MRDLQHIKSIQAFEAAARHLSFPAAAKELFVTPAAVGQQVRLLESVLGFKLFQRQQHGSHRLSLTPEAERALPEIQLGFRALAAGMAQLRAAAQSTHLTISASQVVTSKWLLPILEAFADRYPDIDIRLEVTDKLVDLAVGQADVAIRCGGGNWPGLTAEHLFDESMIVVCAPSLSVGIKEPADLLQFTLLHDSNAYSGPVFPDWEAWFGALGLKLDPNHKGFKINAPLALIDATIMGQGIALVRHQLVKADLAAGRLHRVCSDIQHPVSWGYYLVWSSAADNRPSTKLFRSWLLETVRAK